MPPTVWTRNIAKLKGVQRTIAQAIDSACGLRGAFHGFRNEKEAEAVGYLGWEKGMDISAGFAPEGDHYKAIAGLVGPAPAALARRLWQRRSDYPYDNPGRMPYRTADTAFIPVSQHTGVVFSFLEGLRAGFDIDSYLDERGKGDKAVRFGRESEYVDQVIGVLLDEDPHADALFKRIADIVRDESGKNGVAAPLLGGLLHCRRPDAHALVAELLLDAGLQEGLRKTILQAAGQGVREAFLHIVAAVIDRNLIRYSSAVEAFNSWTGLAFKAAPPATVKKAANDAWRCLSDAAFRKESLAGGDPLLHYLALWAEAQDGLAGAAASAQTVLAGGKRVGQAAAAYFLSRTVAYRARLDAAVGIVADPDARADALLMGMVFRLLDGVSIRLDEHPQDTLFANASIGGDGDVQITSAEACRIYGIFKAAFDALPDKKEKRKSEVNIGGIVSCPSSGMALLSFMMECAKRAVVRPKTSVPGRPITYDENDPYAKVREKWGLPKAGIESAMCSPFVRDSLDDVPADAAIRDDICAYAGQMDARLRSRLVYSTVRTGEGGPVQREALMQMLGDASAVSDAWHYAADVQFSEDEYRRIEGYAKKKNGFLRQALMVKLLARDPAGLGRSVQRLLADKNAALREVGKELLGIMARHKDDPAYQQVYADCRKASDDDSPEETPAAPTPNVMPVRGKDVPAVPAASCDNAAAPAYTVHGIPIVSIGDLMNGTAASSILPLNLEEEGGYGLVDLAIPPVRFAIPDMPDIQAKDAGRTIFPLELKDLTDFLDAVEAVIAAHAGEEYESIELDGSERTTVVGSTRGLPLLRRDDVPHNAMYRSDFKGYADIDSYPFADEWRRLMAGIASSAECIVFLRYIRGASTPFRPQRLQPAHGELKCPPDMPWYAHASELIAGVNDHVEKNIRYPGVVEALGAALESLVPPARLYPTLRRLFLAFLAEQRRRNGMTPPVGCFPLNCLRTCMVPEDDARFADFFTILYEAYYGPEAVRRAGPPAPNAAGMESTDLVRAHRLGLLPDNDVMRLLIAMCRDSYQESYPDEYRVGNSVEILTEPRLANRLFKDNAPFKKLLDSFTTRVVEFELRRGEMSTPLSAVAGRINSFPGVRYFVELIDKLGDADYKRYGYSPVDYLGKSAKTDMFSFLLGRSYPAPGEGGAALGKALANSGVATQRLLDAAMFASQWIAPAAEWLGWKELESMCWYFQAHINEKFTTEKVNAVARYSGIAPEEFNDGACDVAWYGSVRGAQDDKQYRMIYKAAKNITNGASYRRAQLFADAMDGKFQPDAVEKDIAEKRSQAKVLLYGLIPLDKKNARKDMTHRYAVLQRFLKESRTFGVKRRTSEARAVAMGVQNLARNAGYDNTVRFTWEMEDALSGEANIFAKRALDDKVTAWLEQEDDGGVVIRVEKDGKAQKSVPAALRKAPAYLDLVEARGDWRDQQARNRRAMEQAMIHGEVLELAELARLAKNPVFARLLGTLVYKAGDALDYLDNLIAAGVDGRAVVAHPYHLKEAGVWAKFQKDLFDRHIRQPFKQVFRELYVPTEEERNAYDSSRYSGYQVKPTRGVGVMKSLDWLANFDGGMEKLYRREGIIVWMHSGIVWLGDGLAENPTIDRVSFAKRRRDVLWRNDSLAIKDVPPVIFSEVMRDLDLLVSVAYAGDVDPEASQSTLEMRLALAGEMVRLFKLKNVTFKKTHAFVQGVRGEYTIHLGSGVVHKMASGSLNVVAVPSQHRGELFLPFADNDPRTAEVMTKILLFARDNEIKDPTILEQING